MFDLYFVKSVLFIYCDIINSYNLEQPCRQHRRYLLSNNSQLTEYEHGRKTYNSGVCIKGSTSSEFEVDYYGRLEEVIELQYHSEQNRVFLFKCYWYDTTDRGIRVDPHYGLVEINSKTRLCNINDIFVFAKQCQQVYTYTPLPLERTDQELIGYPF